MNYKHKNINEPLRLLVNLGKGYSGESFRLTFSTQAGGGIYRHICRYDAATGTYISCERVSPDQILCTIPPRKIGTGRLVVNKSIAVEDWSMAEGVQTLQETTEVTVPIAGRDWGIELTTAATDKFTPTAITMQMLPLFTRGRPGKTKWSALTDDEKRECAALLADVLQGHPSADIVKSPSHDEAHAGYATVKTPGVVRIGEGLIITTDGIVSIDWSYVRRKLASTDAPDTPMRLNM